MKSKNRIVTIYALPKTAHQVPFLQLAQRHFEKDPPQGDRTFAVPLDFLRMVLPEGAALLEDIEEITVTYRKIQGV